MRTGGMDPSRSSKHRKRSPKSKHKKSNAQQPAEPPAAHPGQSSAELAYPPAPEEASRGSPLPPDSLALTSPTDEEVAVEEMLNADTTIATTPVAGHSVVDIQVGFQVCDFKHGFIHSTSSTFTVK